MVIKLPITSRGLGAVATALNDLFPANIRFSSELE